MEKTVHSYIQHKSIQQVFLENSFQVFQHKVYNDEDFEPFIANNECIQICVLRSEHGFEEKPISLQIDKQLKLV